jgi:hypothetical protein
MGFKGVAGVILHRRNEVTAMPSLQSVASSLASAYADGITSLA